MDFDEYEYLEKSVESPSSAKVSSKKDNGERPLKSSRNREDDVDAFGDYKSKKPRGEYQNGKKEERDERERSSRSHRRESDGQGTVKDRERDRDRVSEKEREREKEKERTRDREREKERKREKEKEKEKDRENDREKERSRRSSSRSRGHREGGERENDRGRSRDRDIRGREPDIDIRERDVRKFKDKKEVEAEADPERDQRTVFAYQMPLKASERDVYEFFSKAGKVRDVRLIMDRNSRRSKGVGYIEFYDSMSVPMAIALSGQLLLGQPVMVKPSEAEKNLVQSTASSGSGLGGPGIARKLYVGNLHFNFTEDQLRQVFEPFGPVELVQLPLDLETGHCKGFGFVQFAQLEHAKAAQSLNGKLEIAGRVIKVSAVTDHIGVHDGGTNVGDFDDDESGLSLNAQSRAMLMQKLDRTGTASSIAGSLGIPLLGGPTVNQQALGMALNGQSSQVVTSPTLEPIGDPSECLLLKNMFDPASEMDPDFDLDIKEEVHEECSNFGLVKHIYVDKKSAGFVYLRFATIEAAMKAQKAMHMRWFARRLITALFMRPHEYGAKFGGSS